MLKKTKIVCTLGPSSNTPEIIEKMIKAGMNVARFNFSHGSHEEHKQRIDMVRAASQKLGIPVALLLDTKGPEIRLGKFKNGSIMMEAGKDFTLTARDVEGDETIASMNYKELPQDVKAGDHILLSDGLVNLEVVSVEGQDIHTKILNSGKMSDRKRVAVPGIAINLPAVSDTDADDIEFGCRMNMDWIAASFIQRGKDVLTIRKILEKHDSHMKIISKIECQAAVNNIDDIIKMSDGIMVARGDLGVEVPFEELPEIQKNIIKTCISRGKRVVTATQMLESMAKNPRPTRAEVSDVANAVYDGTSAIMLSGETSVGKYPVETVATMSRIAENAERTIHYDRRRVTRLEFQNMHVSGDMKTLAISHATCSTSADLGAKCIVAFTESGSTARAVSTYRPGTLIVAATPCEQTFNRLSMSWGVKPVLVAKRPSSGTELYSLSEQAAIQTLDLRVGDIITITAGMPVGHVNYTNTLRVHQLTELSFAPFVQD